MSESNSKLNNCDLLVIDEAASIPVNYVKALISGGDYPSFISSTVHGYEGTGRSLSLKLIHTLRAANSTKGNIVQGMKAFRRVKEISMDIPIRYGLNDQ